MKIWGAALPMIVRLLFLLIVLLSAPLRARPAESYKEHKRRAEQAYRAGRYEEALHEARAAYDKRPDPSLLYNMGKASQKLGRLQDARDFFDRYLHADLNITPEDRAKAEAALEEVRAQLPAPPPPPPPEPTQPEPVGPPEAAQPEPAQPEPPPQAPPVAPVVVPQPALAAPTAPAWRAEPAPPLVIVAAPGREPRPKWRIITGAVSLGVGLGLIGVGSWALAVDSQCTSFASGQCTMEWNTQGSGIGLVGGGAALVIGGVVLLALPGHRRH